MADSETTQNETARDEEAAPAAEAVPAAETAPATAAPAPPPELPPMAYETDPRYAALPAPRPSRPQARMPFLASLFSVFPGLGNVYNGLYLRGITFFVICIGLIGVAASSQAEEQMILVILAVVFVWLFNIFDAYRQATLINYGYTPSSELPIKASVPAWSSGGLMLGVVVFLLGFYFFLHNRFDFDLSVVIDNIDVLLMLFGGFLIGRWVIEWKKSQAGSEVASEDL